MKGLTTEELEIIRIRLTNVVGEGFLPSDGIFVIDSDENIVAECNNEQNAQFMGNAHWDITRLLAEVERLRSVLTHIDELSDEFFEIEVINGKLMFVICDGLEGWSDILREISITSNKAVNA